jgi:hypothetical protein
VLLDALAVEVRQLAVEKGAELVEHVRSFNHGRLL